jgi:hypothetical protein
MGKRLPQGLFYFPGGPAVSETLTIGIRGDDGSMNIIETGVPQGSCRWYLLTFKDRLYNRYDNGTEWSGPAELVTDGSLTPDDCQGEY